MHGKNVMVAQVFSKTPLNISFRMEPLTELNGLLGAPNGRVHIIVIGSFYADFSLLNLCMLIS